MRSNSIFALERSLGLAPLKVDKDSGTIFNVKIIGFDSENNRKYLPNALKEARGLYEGVKVNIDHPKEDPSDARSAYDRFGKLINIRYIEGKGLFGDLVYLKSHPMASRIIEAAERMPEAFGLSHNAQGEGEKDGDIFVVNKVTEVRHVDLVADPATTKSLSEGVPHKSKKIAWSNRSTVGKFDTKRRSKMAKNWLEQDDDKKPMEDYEAPENEKDTKEDDSEKDDLASKVMDALKEADSSDEEKAQKIVDLVKEALGDADMKEEEDKDTEEEDEEPVKEGEEEDKPTEEDDDEVAAKESKKFRSDKKLNQLQEQITRMKRENYVRRLCESSGLPLTKALLEDFLQLPTRNSIERHVLRLAMAHKATKPKSGARVTESIQSRIPSGNNLYNWLKN